MPEERRTRLAEKLIREFEDLLESHPYQTYGAGVKKRAEELIKKSKKGYRPVRGPWNLSESFSDNQLRLMLTSNSFAKEMLKEYDPHFKQRDPNPSEINSFRNYIQSSTQNRLFPNMAPGARYPKFNADQKFAIREGAEADIAEKKKLASQAELLLGQTSRLAPLTALHTSAKQMLQGNNHSESLRLGREEVAAAGRTNIPREIDPYLKLAGQSPGQFLKKYNNKYTKGLIKSFRREAAKDFLEHDLPRINNQFASRGAFYSGAREAAINKARERKEQRIENEIARLLHSSHEEGMKHFHTHRGHHLKQAEVAGHAHQAEKDSHLRAAEALRVNSAVEQASLHQQVAALNQMARTEQQQAQNELNVRQQEHREEMERPFLRQSQKAALVQGVHSPQTHLSPESINPPPPNVYGMASGLVGQMAGLMGQPQQPQQHAKGGHVRRKYAEGDSVRKAVSQLREMRKRIEDSPEEVEMRQAAQNFKNYRANPMADYLFAAGSHQLANLGSSPLKSFGEGSQLGMQAYKAAQGANLSAQEKFHNLMDKINKSKMDQHQFLAKYHLNTQENEELSRHRSSQHGEMVRHHKAMEEESKRAHDINSQHHKDLQELALEKLRTEGLKPAKKSSTERKIEDKHLENIIENNEIKKDLDLIEDAIGNASIGTGPRIGPIKSFFGIDQEIDALGHHIVTKANKLWGKGAGSNLQLKTLQSGKPGQHLNDKANKTVIMKYRQEAEARINKNIAHLLREGWSPKDIMMVTGIEIPKHLLGEEFIEDAPTENKKEESQDESMISMVDPNGKPLSVPQSKLEKALSLGANIVQ